MGAITRAFANNVTTSLGQGGFVHIKTLTAGGVSSLDFINGTSDVVLDSTYNVYKIIGHRVDFGSTQGLVCRSRVSGSFVTSGYETQSASLRGNNSAYDISGGSLSSGYIRMGWQRYTGTTAGFSANFESTFYNLSSTAKDKHMITVKVGNGNTTNDAVWQIASGTLDSAAGLSNAVDGLRIGAADFSTNISGSFALYGLKG